MPRKTKITATTLKEDERTKLALRLRASGKSYQEISEWPYGEGTRGMLYGGDRHNARRAIIAARAEAIREPAQEVIDMELERLDMMFVGLVAKGAFKGSVPAVNAGLNLMKRRAALLGLDQPVQIEQTGDGTIIVEFNPNVGSKTGMAKAEIEVEIDDA